MRFQKTEEILNTCAVYAVKFNPTRLATTLNSIRSRWVHVMLVQTGEGVWSRCPYGLFTFVCYIVAVKLVHKKNKHCMHNVTTGRVRATVVALEKHFFFFQCHHLSYEIRGFPSWLWR